MESGIMPKFAVVEEESNIVVNVIIADSKEIAEDITKKTCINIDTQYANIGNLYIDGTFIKDPNLGEE
jgi:hypothetical protein